MEDDGTKLPWYRNNQVDPPFRLTTCFKNLRGPEYSFVTLFPWSHHSLHSLRPPYLSHFSNGWSKFIENYAGSMVLGGAEELYLIRALQSTGKQKKQIRLDAATKLRPITAVAWALSRNLPLDPLLVIAMSSVVCVYSIGRGEPIAFLRGHGGPITSIAVHPCMPSYICTTSSDQTARIYVLDDSGSPEPNPFWLPGTGPSKGGAPHGLRPSEREVWGEGLCIAVLVGGRSGGHLAAVTCAAFHPAFPLIATGGMDRVVKIWRLHDYDGHLIREDKPLYSSTLVHRSAAASVAWLGQDTLITHCTYTPFSTHIVLEEQPIQGEDDERELEWFGCPGRIVILRWLGLNRFFPPRDSETTQSQSIQRGCISDYQESSSFTIIASIPLPYHEKSPTPHLRVFGDVYHDHIILVAHQRTIHLLNTSHISGLETSDFPIDPEQLPLCFMRQSRLRVEASIDAKWLHENRWPRDLGWCIDLDPRFSIDEDVQAVDMGLNGEVIVAVGNKGSMWVWTKEQ